MYSGTTLTKYSGRLMGAHQKIDRISRRHLAHFLPKDNVFPTAKTIIHFEGRNGPDGIKIKSPAKDEPWHYYNPFDEADTRLPELIQGHYDRMVQEMRSGNHERVAFEAAWLAHAIVDGLTPAHHYPYEEKLIELMGGQGLETRTTVLKKNIMPGENRRKKLKNNWMMWGPRGLLLGHGLFEIGIATLIKPLHFAEAVPNEAQLRHVEERGVVELFKEAAREIAVLDMFENYSHKGWTPRLAWQVRHKLGPAIVQTVTLAWYSALVDANLIPPYHESHRRHTRRQKLPKP